MNCDSSWKFSAPLKLVDVNRILKEAGPYTKCVRLTIDGKVYTLVNSKRVGVLPNPLSTAIYSVRNLKQVETCERDATTGEVLVCAYLDVKDTAWKLYKGDVTGEIVDRVKVSVEVYK